MMATMDRPSRIVRCPKCLALLQEPPPGTPLYKCGNCSTVLRAKHASADVSRRPSTRVQQPNRATPPGHADSIDGRKLPSKSTQPEHTSRQSNLGDPDDQISRTGNSRPTAADTGKTLPSHAHHSSYPPGPTPPLHLPNSSNTNDDNGLRPVRDHQRLLAAHSSGDDNSRRGREGLTIMPQPKVTSPAHVEEARAGNKLPNHVLYNILSPPADRSRNSAAKYDTVGEKDGLADLRTRNMPIIESANNRQKSPYVNPAAEAPRYRRPPAEVLSEGSTKREGDRQLKPEDKDEKSDDEDEQEPTVRRSSTARSGDHLEVIGSFGPIKSSSSPHFSPHRSPESIPGVNRYRRPPAELPSEGSIKRESDRQLKPEDKDEKSDDEDEQEPTVRRSSTSRSGDQLEVIRSFGPTKSDTSPHFSPHRSPESIPEINRYRRPPAEVPSEGSTKRGRDRPLEPEDKDEQSDDEDEQEPTDGKLSTSRSGDQFEVIGSFGPVKSGASPHFSPHRSPESIPGVNRYRRPPAEVRKEASTKRERARQFKPEDKDEKSDDEDEQEPTDGKSPTSKSGDQSKVFGSTKSGASPHFSPHRSPESIDGVSPSQAQASDQPKQELEGTFTRESASLESNSFSFGQGGEVQGSAYPLLKGQTQKVRLQINTPVPERIHVRCRRCSLQLEVPLNLPRSETGIQKLRCGSCWKISRFRLNHLLSPSGSLSPGASDDSPESSFRLGSNSSSGRYSGTRSNRETGPIDRVVLRTQSGANLPVPPSARHNPRGASGSKLANMVSGSGLPSETSKASTPNTSGDLGPVGSSSHGGRENVDMSFSGHAEPLHVSLSPALSSTSQDISSKDRQQKTSPDRKILQSSSDSDEEKATPQLKIGPTGFNPVRMTAWSAPETPEFDDGHEFKGLKGFLKKSVKELTKSKKSSQYRRKVVVNGHAVPDDVVKRAEEFAGAIHPGTYWYDYRAGFWGVMGGPCLGMVPPFIEELNFPLARHCSHGKTGVLVNGRELHHKDLELLKKRGLPGTPGKGYNVDIDGRLTEETTGIELKGLGRLAPTLEQTGRGPGMWVPESQRGS